MTLGAVWRIRWPVSDPFTSFALSEMEGLSALDAGQGAINTLHCSVRRLMLSYTRGGSKECHSAEMRNTGFTTSPLSLASIPALMSSKS